MQHIDIKACSAAVTDQGSMYNHVFLRVIFTHACSDINHLHKHTNLTAC